MTKIELADYLSNLVTLDSYLDDLGVSYDWLNREETERFNELGEIIQKEQKEADARKSRYDKVDEPQTGTVG